MRFDAWFKEQFGKRPSNEQTRNLKKAWLDARWAARKAEANYNAVLDWESKRTAALYAWQAQKGKE